MPAAELKAMLRTSLGQRLLEELAGDVPAANQPVATAFEAQAHTLLARVATYHSVALEAALARTSDKAEVRRLARAYLARTDTLLGRHRMLENAVRCESEEALIALESHCCEGVTPRATDAAAAVLAAEYASAPRRLRNRFARLLVEALEREPEALAKTDVAQAAAIARRRVGQKKPRARKPTQRKAASKPVKAASALKRPKVPAADETPGKRTRSAASRRQPSATPLTLQVSQKEETPRARS